MCMVFFIWDMDYCGCILMNNRSRLCFFFFFFFLSRSKLCKINFKKKQVMK